MAFFEFLAGAAVARFVGLDLRLVTNIWSMPHLLGIAGRCRSSHCAGECHAGRLSAGTLLLEAFESFDLFLLVTLDDLEVEQSLDRVGVDTVEHILEHIERLLFVLD